MNNGLKERVEGMLNYILLMANTILIVLQRISYNISNKMAEETSKALLENYEQTQKAIDQFSRFAIRVSLWLLIFIFLDIIFESISAFLSKYYSKVKQIAAMAIAFIVAGIIVLELINSSLPIAQFI